ncbi:MAG TPA: YlxR family protein [Armatimonadota bacterium]
MVDFTFVCKERPVRACAACRTRRPQHELIRVVRTPAGLVCVDRGRKRTAGRGAYLCAVDVCLQHARQRKALQRVLHHDVPPEVFEDLQRLITAKTDAPEPEQ